MEVDPLYGESVRVRTGRETLTDGTRVEFEVTVTAEDRKRESDVWGRVKAGSHVVFEVRPCYRNANGISGRVYEVESAKLSASHMFHREIELRSTDGEDSRICAYVSGGDGCATFLNWSTARADGGRESGRIHVDGGGLFVSIALLRA